MARFSLPVSVPPRDDIAGLLNLSHEAIDRLSVLYVRALGRLAIAAEEVESALGLPPIPVPRIKPDQGETQ